VTPAPQLHSNLGILSDTGLKPSTLSLHIIRLLSSEPNQVSSTRRYLATPVLTSRLLPTGCHSGLEQHRQALKIQRLRQTLTSKRTLRFIHLVKLPSSMPTPLTRETFMSSDYLRIAATQAAMFKATTDGEGIEEVSVPASVRETGTIPDGYSVGESFRYTQNLLLNSRFRLRSRPSYRHRFTQKTRDHLSRVRTSHHYTKSPGLNYLFQATPHGSAART